MANINLPPDTTREIHIYEETTGSKQWRCCDSNLNNALQNSHSSLIVFAGSNFCQTDQYRNNSQLFHQDFPRAIEEDINGAFNCEYTVIGSNIYPTVSWTCFKIKLVKTATDYEWKQPTIYVDWNLDTKRQVIFIIDFYPPGIERQKFLDKIPNQDERNKNPFVWHTTFIREILVQYDQAFWMLRDQVRILEKQRSDPSHPPPNFPLLHDIARHVFHYIETIEVAEHTLQSLVEEQQRWRKEDDSLKQILQLFLKVQRQLLFQEKGIHSLKTRARSLNDRHLNEINLAFNLVSQGFGRNAQSDSAIMKTIGVVSLVYLPGTFVSGVFGTNFFDFNSSSNDEWITSSDFWVYWAVTLPLTLITVLVWALWHFQGVLWGWLPKRNRTDQSSMRTERVNSGGIPLSNVLSKVRTGTMRKAPKRQETV